MARSTRLIYGLDVVALVAVAATHLGPLATPLTPELDFMILALAAFSLFFAILVLGWRSALVFVAIVLPVSWAVEQVGVTTGEPFGSYVYTDLLGVKIGAVPWVIPLMWFAVVFLGLAVASLMVRQALVRARGTLLATLGLGVVSAAVTTAYDLAVDPYWTGGALLAWKWLDGGPYFGVPLQNFLGWVLTCLLLLGLYRLSQRWVPVQPMVDFTPRILTLPVLAYGFFWLFYTLGGEPTGTRVVAAFAMGIPVASATLALLRWQAGAIDQESLGAPKSQPTIASSGG